MNQGCARNTGLIVLALTMVCGLALGTVIFTMFSQRAAATYGPPWESASAPSITVHAQPTPSPISEPAASRGYAAPDFNLSDLEGASINLSDYRGEVVLVNFWATWCGPCRAEMPLFQTRYEALADHGLVILAVSCDAPMDEVLDFRQEFGLTFPIVLDEREVVQDLYRIRSYPTTFVIDREGIIRFVHYGSMRSSQLDNYLAGVDIGL